MLGEVFRNDYYILEADVGRRLVALRRHGLGFPSLDEMQKVHVGLQVPLQPYLGFRMLFDARGGPPGRNDEAFESAVQGARRRLSASFSRVAVVVKTAVGQLQVQRLARAGGVPRDVFRDEAEALAFLLAEP